MTNDPTTDPVGDDESEGRSRRYMASAVILAAIVVLGLVVSLSNVFGGGKDPTPATSGPSSSSGTVPSSSSPTSPVDASVCGLTAVEMAGTLAAAPEATWSLVGTTAAPSIKDQGPSKIDSDGYRSCYARTPVGALLAGANYTAIGSTGALRKKFYDDGLVHGPGRDVLLGKPIPGAGSDGTRIQIAGFRLLRYDGSQADVDLAFRTSNGAMGATVVNLQWSQGDWKVRVAADGSELSPAVQLPSLSGYVLWAGA